MWGKGGGGGGGEAWASIIDPNNAKIVHHESVAYVV